MEKEVWKLIPGTRGYRASSFGRIISPPKPGKNPPKKSIPERIVKQGLTVDGYYLARVVLKDGRPLTSTVSRFIYSAFKGEIPKGAHVDHIDFDRKNNRPENLQVLTPRENIKRSYLAGRFKCKLNSIEVLAIKRSDLSNARLARTFGVSREAIRQIKNNLLHKLPIDDTNLF